MAWIKKVKEFLKKCFKLDDDVDPVLYHQTMIKYWFYL